MSINDQNSSPATRHDGGSCSVLWFRHDLRLADNPALMAAVQRGGPVVCLYVLDDETPGDWALGGASRWWLHHGLKALADDLAALGQRLILRAGRGDTVLKQVVAETGAGALFWNRSYAPYDRAPDAALKQALRDQGVEARSFNANLLSEPTQVRNKSGGVFKVFTPYWKTISALEVAEPLPAPRPGSLPRPESWPQSLSLDALDLRPLAPDWSVGLAQTWTPGEAGAQAQFARFVETGLADYAEGRDRPALEACSRLSPFLKFGHISPRQVYYQSLAVLRDRPAVKPAVWSFLREIGWRDFSYYLLYHFPTLPHANWRPEFDRFPWDQNEAAYKAWCAGQTGYPMVDAGMRELWQTGYMHNRLRMISGSFLVKHLLLPWQLGERWFWDTLVDADIASNSASWQWVSGCGADAAPYFRVFNPITQGTKFDPEGRYTRRYVPELAGLDNRDLYAPWDADPLILESQGVRLGRTYPRPLVVHAEARARALDAFQQLKKPADASPSSSPASPAAPSDQDKAKAA